jgi:hypothetical protein
VTNLLFELEELLPLLLDDDVAQQAAQEADISAERSVCGKSTCHDALHPSATGARAVQHAGVSPHGNGHLPHEFSFSQDVSLSNGFQVGPDAKWVHPDWLGTPLGTDGGVWTYSGGMYVWATGWNPDTNEVAFNSTFLLGGEHPALLASSPGPMEGRRGRGEMSRLPSCASPKAPE